MKKSIRIFAILSIMFFLVALTSCEEGGSTSLGTYQLTLVNLANNEETEISHEWNSELTAEELIALNIPNGYYIETYDENNQKINLKTNIILDRVYYRLLPNKYDLTFIGDKGRLFVAEVEYNTDISKYANENSIDFVRAEKTGYDFIGWHAEGENTAPLYTLDKMPARDLTLKAKFEKADYNFTVRLNVPSEIANDPALAGVVDPIINTTYQYKDRLINFLTADQKKVLTSLPGYVFGGWYLDSNFQTAFTDTSMPGKDIELWGRWYNMGINLIDGNNVIVNLTGEPNQPIALPTQYTTYYKEGYNFLGWYEKDAQGNYFANAYDFTSIPSGVVSLYAKYEAADVNYLVRHHFEDLNGGYLVENEPLTAKAETLVNATIITRTGFQKVANHQDEHLSGTVNADGTLVLDVYYERLSYAVTFNLNNGSQNIVQYVKYQAAAVAPNTPTKVSDAQFSYVFKEWDKQLNNITSSTIINAVYTSNLRTYTVKFYAENGTTVLANNTVNYDSLVSATAPTPTKAEDNYYTYAFKGWVAMNYSPIYSSTNMVTTDLSYKASWTASAKSYDLVYNLNGRTDASAVTNDTYSVVDLPTLVVPSSVSHNFVGWFTKNGTGNDWGTQVSSLSANDYGNKTLYAKWAIKTFTVKFYDENGTTELASNVVNYDSLVSATAPTPTKASTDMLSYAFDSWVKMTNEPDYVATNKVTSNLSYKATYTTSDREYAITYELNGGTWTGNAGVTTYRVGSAVTYNLVNKTDCIFEGWYTKSGAGDDWGEKVTGITASEFGNKKIYAKWTEPKTIQEVIDAEVSTNVWYIVTGKVGAIADANALKHGNFDLIDPNDPTIKIYVYGVANANKEKEKFAEMNIFEGDTITIIANRTLFKTTKQLGNAYYVSHVTKTLTDTERVTRDADRMADYSGSKTEDFTVPTSGISGTTFAWSSSNPAVLSVNGGNITVTPGATDTALKLTVTVSYGGATPVPVDFDILVPTLPLAGEQVIYSTDFENSAYVATTTYDNTTPRTFNDWSTTMGTISTTAPINGTKSMQMRSYKNNLNIGLMTTFNAYDRVTRFTFNAKSTNGTPTLVVKYNVDGVSYTLTERFGRRLSTTVQEFEYVLPSTTSNVKIEIYNEAINEKTYLVIDDVKIYGIPSTATKYSVTYAANNGSGSVSDVTYYPGEEATAAVNTFTDPDGRVLAAWNTLPLGNGTSYYAGDKFNVLANTTLYAQWRDAREFALVTDISELTNGCEIMIVARDYDEAMSSTAEGFDEDENLYSYSITENFPTNTISPVSGVVILSVLEKTANSDYWLMSEGKYLTGSNSNNTSQKLSFASIVDLNTSYWKITISNDGIATIKYSESANELSIRYLGGRFRIFPIGMGGLTSVLIYKKITTPSTTTYTVDYDANTGSGTMADTDSPYAALAEVTVKANTFTAPAGKVFDKWNTEANGSGTDYAPNAKFNISANTTLYAQWKTVYTVSYDANTGSGTMADTDSPYAALAEVTVKANTFTAPAGKVFDKWNTEANGSGTDYAPNAKFNISANTTLYAQWCDASQYTLVTNITDLAINDTVIIVASGYDFAMSTTQNGNNRGNVAITKSTNTITEVVGLQEFSLKAGNIANSFAFYTGEKYLFAAGSPTASNYLRSEVKLSDNSSWEVTIDAAGVATIVGKGTSKNKIMRYNQTSKLFSCYGSGQYDISIYKKVDAPSATTYTVSYDANTGSGTMADTDSPYAASAEVTVKVNTFTAPAGKVFDKWNTEANGSGTDYAPNAKFNISANTTLYAQWKTATVTPDLFFSEYGEGSSNNKWLEIYNPTTAAINLKNYKFKLYANGASTSTEFNWTEDTMIAAGGTHVIYHTSVNADISSKGQTASTIVNFNGDDAVALCKKNDATDTIIDLIGVIGTDPGTEWKGTDSTGATASTKDMTLVRVASVKCGNTTFTWSEWTAYEKDTFTYVGAHTVS